jgi:RES domain-containing protein
MSKPISADLDDPKKSEFASWRGYQEFARHVRQVRRHIPDDKIRAFLDTVHATCGGRDVVIPQGKIFYRAQHGIDLQERHDEEGNLIGMEQVGFGAGRMRPLPNRAAEGRINPKGIPVLYLASSEQTAISEVRPWVGSDVSVAQFKLMRQVRMLNLSIGHGQSSFNELTFDELSGERPISAEKSTKAVWVDIDNAFSCPVTLSDDAADYVPTQILAEFFRSVGYDGVIYRSQFGEKGYNLALFNVADAEAINCAPCEVTAIEVKFQVVGNRWFSRKHLEENK